MFSWEDKIIRGLAVAALAAALAAVALIAVNSGVIKLKKDTSSTGQEAIASPAAAATAAAGQPGAAEPAASGSAPADVKSYTVQEGDSFFTISRKLNISIAEIQQKNPNLDPSNLVPGTKINIP